MGSFLEMNDTLQITTEQGFPSDVLNLETHVAEQTIQTDSSGKSLTSGKYKIIALYPPEYQREITMHESPKGLSLF